MKPIFKTLLFFGFLSIFLFSCSDDDPEPEQSSAKAITSFTVSGTNATIDESAKTISANLSTGTDLTTLTPEIIISPLATVAPASGVAQDFTNPVTYTVTAEDGSTVEYDVSITIEQCANSDNIYSFTYNGKNYEVIKENKTWIEAAACAVERGGFLAEINDAAENNALFDELTNNASITLSNTSASDGGEASYVWIGGNDITTESTWIWDGNNDDTGTQFWEGNASGSPVGGLFNNWGNEPDDYNSNQDGLGLALTEWPLGSGSLGVAGQWNDVRHTNKLYYVIEYN